MIQGNRILITLIIPLVLLIGCKTIKEINQDQLLGKYQWHGTYGIASNITLNKDNSFIYHWQQGLIGGTTKGTWILQGNTLLLNSTRQPEEKTKFDINSYKETNTGEYKIHILDKEKNSLHFAVCALLKDSTFIDGTETNENGICKLDMTNKANTVQISYLGYTTVEIPISKLRGNEFSVTMFEGEEFYEYFTNRKWKVTNRRIINPEIKADKYTKNYYEKIE